MTDRVERSPRSPVRWRIDAAHVVVLPDSADLEAIHLVDLDVEEGREEAVPDRDDRPDAWSLRYYCTVRPRGASAPDAWVGADAAVTIVGIDAGGATVTMVGRALFGRGDDGAFEIEFGAAPSMTTWHKDGHAAPTPN